MSVLNTLPPREDQERRRGRRAPADTRESGTFETIAAGLREARGDTTGYNEEQKEAAYSELIRVLNELGYPSSELMTPSRAGAGTNYDRVYALALREKANGHFKDLPATRVEFDRQWRADARAYLEEQAAIAARGSGAARFVGGVAGAMTDPVNLLTLPVGGAGKTIASRVISEALANMAIEAVSLPNVAAQREELGREGLTAGEAIGNVVLAGVGAAAIRGGLEVSPNIDSAAYRAIAPLREAIDGKLATRDVARALAQANPAATLTPDQQAAVNVLVRAEEIEAASPFVDTYAARDAHAAKLAEAMESLENGRVAAAGREGARLAPVQAPPVSVASAAVTGDFDMGRYLARNRVAESGGDDTAAAATSSAYGRYQFVKDTWIEFYKRTFGNTGESRAAILAKRADGAVQDRVMQTFTRANADALRDAGVPVTDGTVYLAHFLGQRDAVKVLQAAGETPIGSLVSRASVRANRAVFDDVVTAAELVRWADRKMGSRTIAGTGPSPAAGGRSAIDDALEAEEALIAAEEARLAGDDPFPARFEPEVPQLKRELFGSDTEWRIAQAEVEADLLGRDPGENLLYRLRQVVADRDAAPSLNQVDRLARELGTTSASLREALDRLSELGELRRTARGHFARLPRAATAREPEDLVRFVARNGGLSYDGLNDAGRKLGTRGHDLRNTGAMARFVPGVGPLLRPGGRSLDEAAELAWEAGYFGPPEITPRPSENDFLQAMDRATRGEKIVASSDRASDPVRPPEEPWQRDGLFQSRAHYESERARFDAAAQRLLGRTLDEEEFLDAFDQVTPVPTGETYLDDPEWWEAGLDLDVRLQAMVNRRLNEALDDAFFEAEDAIYDVYEQLPDAGAEGRAGGEGREGQAADAGDAGTERPRGRTRPGDAQDDQLSPAQQDAAEAAGIFGPPAPDEQAARAFDSDAGEGVKAIAESDWHDIRAQAEDPNIAARRRQEAQLRADAPLRGANATGQAQDSEMGLALFDAADQPTFDLDDGKGPRTAAEIDDEISAERAGIEEIRKCLK